MTDIVLTGLKGDSPIGAMAAFGLLRVCSEPLNLSGAKLRWFSQQGNWTAVLSSEEGKNPDVLIRKLMQYAASRSGATS